VHLHHHPAKKKDRAATTRNAAGDDAGVAVAVAAAEAAIGSVRSRDPSLPAANGRRNRATTSRGPKATAMCFVLATRIGVTMTVNSNRPVISNGHDGRDQRVSPLRTMTVRDAADEAAAGAEGVRGRATPARARALKGRAPAMRPTLTTNRCP
jgi:hypothetical protein